MLSNVDIINIVSWLLFGLTIGYIVHLFDDSEVKGGVFGTVLTGIVGALIGGFLSYRLFGTGITGFNIYSLIIATIGAFIFTIIERVVFRDDISRPYDLYGFKGGRSRRHRDDY